MRTYLKISELPQPARDLIKSAFPGYRKKSITVVRTLSEGTVEPCGFQWDGGSKTDWRTINLDTGRTGNVSLPSWPKFEAEPVEYSGMKAVVSSGTFCGKTATLTFYVDNAGANFFGVAE